MIIKKIPFGKNVKALLLFALGSFIELHRIDSFLIHHYKLTQKKVNDANLRIGPNG